MITRSAVTWHTEDWQQQLSQVVTSVDELWQLLIRAAVLWYAAFAVWILLL